MITFEDYEGRRVILSEVAEHHIVAGHKEIAELGARQVIEEALGSPDVVIERFITFA